VHCPVPAYYLGEPQPYRRGQTGHGTDLGVGDILG